MDTKRLIVFVVLSVAILFGWQQWFAPKIVPGAAPSLSSQPGSVTTVTAAATPPAVTEAPGKLQNGGRIKVNTDVMQAEIDTMGGDLRKLTLTQHGQHEDVKTPFVLFQEGPEHVYVAQTGLIKAGMPNLPTHRTLFTAKDSLMVLQPGFNSVSLRLEAPEVDGVKVAKIYTFKRGSYVIDVKHEVTNGRKEPLDVEAYFRLMRDGKEPRGSGGHLGASTFTGPAVYTGETKFQKVAFKDIDKGEPKYAKSGKDGWIAMLQHYFASAWLLSPNGLNNTCGTTDCRFVVERVGDLYSAGAIVKVPTIAPGATGVVDVPLYAGPQETRALEAAASGLDLVKDYGIFTVLAKPMFWVLDKIHALVGNWGWAIVIFTLLIKLAFYPLSAASYRSMAKMKKLAPRMQKMKEQYGDDRMKFQQAVMEMYKQEKANPIAGCLPVLVQIPVFMGLYWMLLAAVELRQAPWILWIHDLSVADPYYVLPILMAISMYVQTLLNPPAADPMQDKMMKIMPLVMSVMFIFFPAGLVLYWVVNNLFSIGQQWYITRMIEGEDKAKAR
ncbi:membrane protein insertase YidC [Chitinimonas sp. BJB300]|uniref:membrane protein insertase YidC n=1 Tax=Chitinimonas sp. BJB300 TaxID=1559339 RepID=UPI000C0F1723|nr:membrane protein insertase YidC [Chitinimonas sp. BJB300]PHV11793.1 membrane protein insertase YidC [Chitinimonas sp. BJB300]TSJ91206.1 membrane protein insertase YidC [Chitinimonas sp. BJB300]